MRAVCSTDGESAMAPAVPELIRKQDHTLVQSTEMGGQQSMSGLLSSFSANWKMLKVLLCLDFTSRSARCFCENSDIMYVNDERRLQSAASWATTGWSVAPSYCCHCLFHCCILLKRHSCCSTATVQQKTAKLGNKPQNTTFKKITLNIRLLFTFKKKFSI